MVITNIAHHHLCYGGHNTDDGGYIFNVVQLWSMVGEFLVYMLF